MMLTPSKGAAGKTKTEKQQGISCEHSAGGILIERFVQSVESWTIYHVSSNNTEASPHLGSK
jgi:hypothetical protein